MESGTGLLRYLMKTERGAEAVHEAFDLIAREACMYGEKATRLSSENDRLRENCAALESHIAELHRTKENEKRELSDEIDVLVDRERGVNTLIENSFRDLGLDPEQGDDTQEALEILLAAWRTRLQGRPTVEDWDELTRDRDDLQDRISDCEAQVQSARSLLQEQERRNVDLQHVLLSWEEKVRSGELLHADGEHNDQIHAELKRELQNTKIALGLAKKKLEDVKKEIHGDGQSG